MVGHGGASGLGLTVPAGSDSRSGARRWLLVTIGAVGLTVGLVEIVAGVGRASPPTHLIVVHVVVGWSFVVSAIVALARRPHNRIGVLLSGTGFAWFTPALLLAESPIAFGFGRLADGLFWAPLAHLFLSFPGGRLSSRVDRAVVACLYVLLPLGNVMGTVFVDFERAGCVDCPVNVLLLRHDPSLHSMVEVVDLLVGAILAVLVLMLFLRRWRRATGAARRVLRPVLWGVWPAFLAAAYLLASSFVSPPSGLEPVVLPFVNLALAALPVGFLVGLLRSQLERSMVGDLLMEMQTHLPHRRLQEALAQTLGDPSLRLAFWLPESGRYVDDEGKEVQILAAEEAENRRVHKLIDSGGDPLAALIHDPALLQNVARVDAVASAARLTLENERLHARLRAQLEDVRASRARLVEASDEARRRLERDLHDGAQQRLLTLSLALERARLLTTGVSSGSELEDLLVGASRELKATLTELRELARGIHPALLTDEGLSPAIESLARRAQLPTRVVSVPAERFPPPTEAAAYFVVSEALVNAAKYAAASEVRVLIDGTDNRLRIEVSDDGVGGADPALGSGLRGLQDRVVALGGMFEVDSPAGRGTTLRADIPLTPERSGLIL